MDGSVEAIAANLKETREKRGLSLDQLAALTSVSKSMLRQIETGRSSPTISTIWKIANGLRISFTALLRKPELEAEVKAFRAGPILTAEGEQYRLYPLIPFDPQQSFETYYFEIDPGTAYCGEPHQGEIDEYVFVTRGTLEIAVAGRVFTIQQDEFLKFHANHPHQYRCIGETSAAAIMQLSYTF